MNSGDDPSDDNSADPERAEAVAQRPPAQSLSPEVRQRLMQQFERWLDQMLVGEAPPGGVPEEILAEVQGSAGGAGERDCDLYTLFSGLTKLTGEVRLQGRAFKQLIDALEPLSQLPERLDRLEGLSDQRAAEGGDLPASGKEICEAMLDLYDRLARGLETCDSSITWMQQRRRGWARRWFGQTRALREATASAEAIRDATVLTLARLDALFENWGIERIGRIGENFDPRRMTVVHVRPNREVEAGTVLEINRSGYARHGHVKTTAQVIVARAERMTE